MGDERWILVYQQLEELLSVALDDWGSVMTIGKYSSWILMAKLMVETLGSTTTCDIFQPYSRLQRFLLAFLDQGIKFCSIFKVLKMRRK
jgi:hypothetical protein